MSKTSGTMGIASHTLQMTLYLNLACAMLYILRSSSIHNAELDPQQNTSEAGEMQGYYKFPKPHVVMVYF